MDKEIFKELNEIKQLLISNKKILTLNELVTYTGYKKSYIYRLTHSNKIPYSRPSGGMIFFDKDQIDSWLMSNHQDLIEWTQSSSL